MWISHTTTLRTIIETTHSRFDNLCSSNDDVYKESDDILFKNNAQKLKLSDPNYQLMLVLYKLLIFKVFFNDSCLDVPSSVFMTQNMFAKLSSNTENLNAPYSFYNKSRCFAPGDNTLRRQINHLEAEKIRTGKNVKH